MSDPDIMQFFSLHAESACARAGTLITRRGPISTPTALLYTRRGGCLYLTPDMMEKLRPQAQGLQINAMQFLDQPNPAQLAKSGAGLHRFIGAPGWPMLATHRDPTLLEYAAGKPSNIKGVYTVIHSGGMHVTPARYMEAIKAIQPEIFVSMADEVLGDATAKRVGQSVERTTKWLDEVLEELEGMRRQAGQQQQEGQGQQQVEGRQQGDEQQAGQQAAEQQQDAAGAAGGAEEHPAKRQRREGGGGAKGGGGGGVVAAAGAGVPLVLAPVVGGAMLEERTRAAKAVADKPVDGFALCGFGMGEDAALHPQLLAAAVEHLPADKPRLLLGMAAPEEVLAGVLAGADLFDCGYPTHATANGYALYFPTHMPGGGKGGGGGGAAGGAAPAGGLEQGADDSKLNIWATAYREDKRPLVEGCSCYACRNHTRAYVHHLLHTHEMLASVLLEAHNTHWWLLFFEGMREAVAAGEMQQYAEWFRRRRRDARALQAA
ncbi:MAG: tRNA-guanine(15) transglycosylase-like protein [Monoraphidium minutum]|nr:MAG: tRNA-guanine(15) transglycosylase-like protein [Monoraphidium minutum]